MERIISDPVFLISLIVQALTVAWVPTGMKAGVLIFPLCVSIKPDLAKLSFAKTLIRHDHLKEVAEKVSLKDMVIETDSYPQYFKKNRERWTEPKDVKLVAEEISKIKKIKLDDVAEITTSNALGFIKV